MLVSDSDQTLKNKHNKMTEVFQSIVRKHNTKNLQKNEDHNNNDNYIDTVGHKDECNLLFI